ncbi:MAG: hypothetical protein KIS62_12280 [Ramlibacter sp.]|nr:hypothetical protein [Ramlibacter sp.]MCW5650515.1 hypothetical protein [Ramlibacter sp.]
MKHPSHFIQNINAPVYGHVAGGDIHITDAPDPDAGWAAIRTSDIRVHLARTTSRLRREQLKFWVNWPLVLGLAWLLGAGGFTLYTLLQRLQAWRTQPPIDGLQWLTMMALVLGPALFFVWRVEGLRRLQQHVVADLDDERLQLERVLALRRAGRL